MSPVIMTTDNHTSLPCWKTTDHISLRWGSQAGFGENVTCSGLTTLTNLTKNRLNQKINRKHIKPACALNWFAGFSSKVLL